MIHRLRGQLVEKDMEGVVVDVGGVGYRASTSGTTLRALPSIGEECVLHTRMVVREDAMLLFGFADREERAAFDALTGVSMAAPRSPRAPANCHHSTPVPVEGLHLRSMPLPEERLDRVVNVVLRVHPARQHFLVIPQMLVQHVDEIAAAVRAGDLAVAEHVARGQ